MGSGIPHTQLRSLDNSSLMLTLETNRDLENLVNNTAMPDIMMTKVALDTGACREARVKILIPPGYRAEDKIGYPTVFHV